MSDKDIIESISTLVIKPDEVVIVKLKGIVPVAMVDAIGGNVTKRLRKYGFDNLVFVVSNEMDIETRIKQ